jgi:hypothetical protein
MKQRSFPLLLVLLVSLPVIDSSVAAAPGIVTLQTAPAAAQMAAATVDGCPVFPADNVWNARVDMLPVDSHSDAYIATIGAATGLHPDFGADWNGGPFGIPYTSVPGSQPLVTVTFDYVTESDPGPYPIPPDAPVEGGSDRHVLVVDRDDCKLYEMWNARRQPGGSWRAGSGAVFDLNSNDLRPDTWTSADAAGLPILPGLVRYDEVAAGAIHHALRFTAENTQQAYVWPARHYASTSTNPARPPMGQRFRLKASYTIPAHFSPEVKVILTALKTYGMFLADNGSNWYISGAPDSRWNDDRLVNELRQVKGSDFEAVDESGLMVDPDSGQVSGVRDLHVTQAITSTGWLTATLGWTAPTSAVTTTVRYAYAPLTEDTWDSAAVITDTLPGSTDMLTAGLAYSGGVVYFALKSQTANGGWTALSNNAFWPHQDVYLPVISRP